MNKGFTLIIPLYNKVFCLSKTLDSVLNNHGTYPFKCIIVDDDSTDGSSDIAEEYDVKYPDVFEYYKIKHHGNKTPVHARNLGIKLTDTEYIGFLDADDELCAGFIDRGCTFLDEHPEYSLYGNGYISNSNNEHTNITYNQNIINNFEDYLISGWEHMHFCANIYKTKLVKDNPFTDLFGEDSVFKLKYIYKNNNIYIDSTYCNTIVYNEQNSESYQWTTRNTDYPNQAFEILETVKNDIPNFKYKFHLDENNNIWIEIL